MKNSIKLIAGFLAVSVVLPALTACDDFLTEEPDSNRVVENTFKNEASIGNGVNSVYNSLAAYGQYGKNFIILMEVRGDNSSQGSLTNSGGIYGDIYLFRESPYNQVLDQTWTECYQGIMRANLVLGKMESVPMDSVVRAKYRGELLFARALSYFNLVRLWGDVPLTTTYYDDVFEAFNDSRTPTAQVYDQIIADLKEAATLLPVKKDKTRLGAPLAYAAKSLLGEVYLTLHEYDKAKQVLAEVVESGAYSLLGDYAQVFDTTNKNSKESVFEIQYSGSATGLGSMYANLFSPAGATELTGGIGTAGASNIPTQDFYDSYAEGDVRRDITVGITKDGSLYCKKFVCQPSLPDQSDANFIVMRYADVMLMYAEALNQTEFSASGYALKLLNKIRKRAGLPELTAADVPDKETFAQALARERRYELAFENHRWFDLLRTGKAIEAIKNADPKISLDSYQLLYPIPQKQIDAAPLIVQNPGY